MSAQPQRLYTEAWSDYALLDAGNGQKLERWGGALLRFAQKLMPTSNRLGLCKNG